MVNQHSAAERRHYQFRRATERLAGVGMVLCTAVTVFFLFMILGYVIYNGASAIDWNFLTAFALASRRVRWRYCQCASWQRASCGMRRTDRDAHWSGRRDLRQRISQRATRQNCALHGGSPDRRTVHRRRPVCIRISGPAHGVFSGFSGSIAYAFIMVPIILITSHEAFRLVPSSLREASLALGVPKWRTILGVVLPVSRTALLTGAVLAFSRALGEAAPMLFTAFGNPFWNLNLGKPIATVPMLIYTYATGPYDDWHQKAWAASFVLMMVVLVTSVMTRAFLRGKSHE